MKTWDELETELKRLEAKLTETSNRYWREKSLALAKEIDEVADEIGTIQLKLLEIEDQENKGDKWEKNLE